MFGVYVLFNYPEENAFDKVFDMLVNHNRIDFIEIGYPFNDPVADGPVIAEKVNKIYDKVNLSMLLNFLKSKPKLKKIYIMSYANIFLNYGLEKFSKDFSPVLDGVIIADLPNRMHSFFENKGFFLPIIPFATPISREEDIKSVINKTDTDFVYYIGVKGTTGSKKEKDFDKAKEDILKVKKITGKNVIYGFGIKNKEDVSNAYSVADGVVIGTEIVKRQQDINELKNFIDSLF